jgi:hypothetical protein
MGIWNEAKLSTKLCTAKLLRACLNKLVLRACAWPADNGFRKLDKV